MNPIPAPMRAAAITAAIRAAIREHEATDVQRCQPVKVTYRNNDPVTDFGTGLTRAVIAGELYDGCSAEAIDAACDAWQIHL
jgi:hypothetical protein